MRKKKRRKKIATIYIDVWLKSALELRIQSENFLRNPQLGTFSNYSRFSEHFLLPPPTVIFSTGTLQRALMKNEANYNNNYMRIPEDSIQAIV